MKNDEAASGRLFAPGYSGPGAFILWPLTLGGRPNAERSSFIFVRLLNIGILAHVDAGKTSLTERLLFETDVIDRLGRVDAGDTQTDTGEIERERGITIRRVVVSFGLGDIQVNLKIQ